MNDIFNQACEFRDNDPEKQAVSSHKDLNNTSKHLSRGLIRGPNEPLASFEKRLQFSPSKSSSISDQALNHFETLFHMRPTHIPITISKSKLRPWEGAVTWIHEHEGVRSCSIQLKSEKPPRFYSYEEIIAHELVHATRVAFDEPLFEEILAFQTSSKKWRRFLGPLFSRPIEALLFLGSLIASWIGAFTAIYSFWLLPAFTFLILFFRLCYHQYLFKKAYQFLKSCGQEPLLILIQSSDAQIKAFARGQQESRETPGT